VSAWTGKSCQHCGGKKGARQANLKYCFKCGREMKQLRSKGAHTRAIWERYGLTAAQYDRLYRAQDGRCYICQRATGKTRRLSVDHDHAIGDRLEAVRALLCRPCNNILGHLRDDPAALARAIEVITSMPAQAILRGEKPQTEH
jgi:hypothetical protein